MSKRGLSGIVTTVIIILLVLAAVAILWAAVRPALQSSADSVGTTEQFSLSFSIVSATSDGTNVDVDVTRNAGGSDDLVQGANVVVKDDAGNSCVYLIDEPFSVLETKTANINLAGDCPGITGSVETVEVAPVIDDGSDDGQVGAVLDSANVGSGSTGGTGGSCQDDNSCTLGETCGNDNDCVGSLDCINDVCENPPSGEPDNLVWQLSLSPLSAGSLTVTAENPDGGGSPTYGASCGPNGIECYDFTTNSNGGASTVNYDESMGEVPDRGYIQVSGVTWPDSGSLSWWWNSDVNYNWGAMLDQSGSGNNWEAWIYGDGDPAFRMTVGGSGIFVRGNDPVVTGEWNHFVAVWNKNNGNDATLEFFVNGVSQGTDVGDWSDFGSDLYIAGGFFNPSGGTPDGCSTTLCNTPGIGNVADFRLYDDVLTQTDVDYLYDLHD